MTLNLSKLPQKITVNIVDLFDETKIGLEFNSFFTNVQKNLPGKTPFEYFVNIQDFVMETRSTER